MKISQRIYEIIRSLYNSNILLARGSVLDVFHLTLMMAQQIAFEFGNNWGVYNHLIIYRDTDFTIWGYDWQDKNTKIPHSPPGEMVQLEHKAFSPVLPIDHLKVEPKPEPREFRIVGVKQDATSEE